MPRRLLRANDKKALRGDFSSVHEEWVSFDPQCGACDQWGKEIFGPFLPPEVGRGFLHIALTSLWTLDSALDTWINLLQLRPPVLADRLEGIRSFAGSSDDLYRVCQGSDLVSLTHRDLHSSDGSIDPYNLSEMKEFEDHVTTTIFLAGALRRWWFSCLPIREPCRVGGTSQCQGQENLLLLSVPGSCTITRQFATLLPLPITNRPAKRIQYEAAIWTPKNPEPKIPVSMFLPFSSLWRNLLKSYFKVFLANIKKRNPSKTKLETKKFAKKKQQQSLRHKKLL